MSEDIPKKSCDICMNQVNENEFWKCDTCGNSHCFSCNVNVLTRGNRKCPFCRTQINNEYTELIDETMEDEFIGSLLFPPPRLPFSPRRHFRRRAAVFSPLTPPPLPTPIRRHSDFFDPFFDFRQGMTGAHVGLDNTSEVIPRFLQQLDSLQNALNTVVQEYRAENELPPQRSPFIDLFQTLQMFAPPTLPNVISEDSTIDEEWNDDLNREPESP